MVDRYNMIGRDIGARMDVSPNGVWVRYSALAAARAENKRLTKERDNLSKLEQSHREQANEQFHRANKAEVERDKARSMLADAERDMRQRAAVAARKTWDGYDAAAHILALPLKHADREGGSALAQGQKEGLSDEPHRV